MFSRPKYISYKRFFLDFYLPLYLEYRLFLRGIAAINIISELSYHAQD
jgi:hypothetical protein